MTSSTILRLLESERRCSPLSSVGMGMGVDMGVGVSASGKRMSLLYVDRRSWRLLVSSARSKSSCSKACVGDVDVFADDVEAGDETGVAVSSIWVAASVAGGAGGLLRSKKEEKAEWEDVEVER